MAQGKFASTGVIVGQTPQSKRAQRSEHLTGNKVTMGKTVPRQTEGAVGDITVREVPAVGLRAYIKTDSGWYDINTMTAGNVVNWVDMVLVNSWVEVSATLTPQYCKDSNGFVHFRGALKSGSGVTTTFCTLPQGFRPSRTVKVLGAVNAQYNSPSQVTVTSAGVSSFFTWNDATSGATSATTAGGDSHTHIVASSTYTSNTGSAGTYIDGVTFFAQAPSVSDAGQSSGGGAGRGVTK